MIMTKELAIYLIETTYTVRAMSLSLGIFLLIYSLCYMIYLTDDYLVKRKSSKPMYISFSISMILFIFCCLAPSTNALQIILGVNGN